MKRCQVSGLGPLGVSSLRARGLSLSSPLFGRRAALQIEELIEALEFGYEC